MIYAYSTQRLRDTFNVLRMKYIRKNRASLKVTLRSAIKYCWHHSVIIDKLIFRIEQNQRLVQCNALMAPFLGF